MFAMVLHKHSPIEERPLHYQEVPKPVPGSDEILVKVQTCGVCRTDLHLVEGELSPGPLPIIPGHQVIGTIESMGKACTRFNIGDRVGIAWLRHTCGECDFCQARRENLCPRSIYTGYMENGGYATHAKVREEFAYPIPPLFTSEYAAPLLCAGIVGYRAYKRSNIFPGGRLGIFGFGSSAHIIMQIALYHKCEVLVSTRSSVHRQLARDMGASWVGPSDRPLPQAVDSAIIFAPAGELIPLALQSIRPGGTVISADITMTPIPAMDYSSCLFHEKDLRSVESNTREDGKELLELAAQIPIKTEVEIFSLTQANEALLKLKQHGIKGSAILKI